MKILVYLIIVYIAYQFFIKPLMSGNKGKSFKKGGQDGGRGRMNVDREPPGEQGMKGGEYIDYEEVKDK